MKLTAKGRYAVTALLDLALHEVQEGAVSLADIAARQQLSQAFLEQLFLKLRKYALVDSIRGAHGGYRLSRQAGEISVADIVNAIDEDTDATYCKGAKNCRKGSACLTHDLWAALNEVTQNFLANVTLADLQHQRYPAFELVIKKGE